MKLIFILVKEQLWKVLNRKFFDIINYYKGKNIGFISGIRKDLLSDNDIKKFPKNVIIK